MDNDLSIKEVNDNSQLNAFCEIAPNPASPHCPAGFILTDEWCYHITKCRMNYADAKAFCETFNHGGNQGRLLSDVDCTKKEQIQLLMNTWAAGTDTAFCGDCCPNQEYEKTCLNAVTGDFTPVPDSCSSCPCEACSVDCVSIWSAWDPCSVTCGGSTQSRYLSITTERSGNGVACPTVLVETLDCGNISCPVDCVFNWGNWTACSVTCGVGITARYPTITTLGADGGVMCPINETEPCAGDPLICNIDCVVDWTPWSACSVTCDNGTQDRTYNISIPQSGNGAACVLTPTTQSCIDMDCLASDCLYNWTSWSACDVTCGPGTRSRLAIIFFPASGDGTPCPDPTTETEPCTVALPCPNIDCEYTWGAWGGCSVTCEDGVITREPNIAIPQSGAGVACPAPETQNCSTLVDCPVGCSGTWGSWSGCSKTCNTGFRTRTFTVTTPRIGGGTPCPCTTDVEACNTESCTPANIYMGCWSAPTTTSCQTLSLPATVERCFENCPYQYGTVGMRKGIDCCCEELGVLKSTNGAWGTISDCNKNCVGDYSQECGKESSVTRWSIYRADSNYVYKACYNSPYTTTQLSSECTILRTINSPEACAAHCGPCAYRFGLVKDRCCCDIDDALLNTTGQALETKCSLNCPGDSSFKCGAQWSALSVYDQEIDKCLCEEPCVNGVCVPGNFEGKSWHTCKCYLGWGGFNCKIDANECGSNPCLNGGVCDGSEFCLWTCTCSPGWTGENCGADILECISNPCLNEAPCIEGTNLYTCDCSIQWLGAHCEEYNNCYPDNCVNGATCVDGVGNYTCLCNPGYTGMNCELDIDECQVFVLDLGFDCAPHGQCINMLNAWYCNCTLGYNGTYCEHEIDECESNPCQHGASCLNEINYYACECVPGYNGTNCETEIMECESFPCVNNGTCDDLLNSYTCSCTTGYNGTNCESEINECDSNPCHNNATCHDYVAHYFCECYNGTDGVNCQNNPDECISSPCQNNGTCQNHFDQYICVCWPEYTDINCDLMIEIWELMEEYQSSLNLDQLLKDIVTASSTIIDSVPFVIGYLNQSSRRALSWSYSDTFEYCKFEDERCDIKRDIHMWDEAALGNCFTWNYENRSSHFKILRTGAQYGLDVWLNIHQEEYVSWTSVSGFKVYIHNQSEKVFAESLSYYAPGGAHVNLGLQYTEYRKKPAPYGTCITDKNSVKYYYYYGTEYTKEACIRSCYQEQLRIECGCADPRYAMPIDLGPCPLDKRDCVNEFLEEKGDPTHWADCECPVACRGGEYQVTVSKSAYRPEVTDCIRNKLNSTEYDACVTNIKRNRVRVTVYFERKGYVLYEEIPESNLFDMMGNVGGQMGILAGLSVISIFEILVMIVRVCLAVIAGI